MSGVPNEKWHIGREVSIATILTIVIQTIAIVWWASNLSERMTQIERRTENQRVRIEAVEVQRIDNHGRLVRLEEQTRQIYDLLRSTSQKLDTLTTSVTGK